MSYDVCLCLKLYLLTIFLYFLSPFIILYFLQIPVHIDNSCFKVLSGILSIIWRFLWLGGVLFCFLARSRSPWALNEGPYAAKQVLHPQGSSAAH